MKNSIHIKERGQALITLLFFVIIGVIITSAAIVAILINSTATSQVEQGNYTYYIAEAGVENALMRLLRDPNYSGETLAVGNGNVMITVTGGGSKVITATSTLRNYKKKIQVQVGYTNNTMIVQSWKEL